MFGGNLAYVRESANMVYQTRHGSDPEKSVRFYAQLIADVGLLTTSADNLAKAIDLRALRELSSELKKTS